jgi:phage baseplate assembly protein W
MRGTNATTGKPLSGLDHLRQSIRDILTTPVGSRVMRRDYGSRLFQLVDAPVNRRTIVDIYAATIEALLRWEPRITPRRVSIASAETGRVVIDLEATYTPTGEPITLDGITVTA